ncbi:MAG: hypothetical protein DWQ44_00340 [Bacteroidetes bacterium]|nr:MAG: hypothetical protein DWQ33_03715 [Bacteroidota bacterium]REK07604.1 MAG: hypothetical protein DWQ39_01555 [Bacteroidota bacterium]REK36964.1 MAG: hypothetical protein DWQ44_00340 [Bacteroidota bacterium]REK47784.1 MAG: hypothetical protein DWQ48_11400 [Bacteroidota bacterium]
MTTILKIPALILTLLFAVGSQVLGQDEGRVFNVQTWLRTADPGFNHELVDSIVKVYQKNVTAKNEKVISARIMKHYMTEDSREMVFIFEYKSLADMEEAFKLDQELAKKAWPDQKTKEAFDKLWKTAFTHHEDRVYGEVLGTRK